jgi:methionine-rich copper-binding protein CopC
MKRLLLMFLSVALLSGSSAFAGSTKLVKSTPEDGSVSDSGPNEFVLEFSDSVTVHEVYLKKDSEKEKLLHVAARSATKTVTIPVPALTAGHYVLEWSVFAAESRVLSGRVRFNVSGAAVASPLSTP